MQSALGALGWTPATFWAASLTEFFAAIDGFKAANGIEDKPDAAYFRDLNARMKAKYGD